MGSDLCLPLSACSPISRAARQWNCQTAKLSGCGPQDQTLQLFPQNLADSKCSQGRAGNQWSSHICCMPAALGTSFVPVHLEAAASERGALSHSLRAPQQSGGGRPSPGTSVCFTTSHISLLSVIFTFKVKQHFPYFRNI